MRGDMFEYETENTIKKMEERLNLWTPKHNLCRHFDSNCEKNSWLIISSVSSYLNMLGNALNNTMAVIIL